MVLAPASVGEVYELTVRAFNVAERYRTPVILLYDEVIGHVRERVDLSGVAFRRAERRRPSVPPEEYRPYAPGPKEMLIKWREMR